MKKLIVLFLFLVSSVLGAMAQIPFTISVMQQPGCGCDGIVTMTVQSLNVVSPVMGGSNIQPSQWTNDGSFTYLTWTNVCYASNSGFINATIDGIPYGQTFILNAPTVLQVWPTTSVATCEPGDYLDVTVSNGSPPYMYEYMQNNVAVQPGELVSGWVTVVVTDVNGCVGQSTVNIPYAYTQNVTVYGCPGTMVNYQGNDLAVGGTYTLPGGGTAPDGCDSMQQVQVLSTFSQVLISGNPTDCSHVTYTASNYPAGTTFLWTPVSSGGTILTDPTQPTVTFQASGGGTVLQLTVNDQNASCPTSYYTPWVNMPQLQPTIEYANLCGDSLTVSLSSPGQVIDSVMWWPMGVSGLVAAVPQGSQTISAQVFTESGCYGTAFLVVGSQSLGQLHLSCADSATYTLANPVNVVDAWWVMPSGIIVPDTSVPVTELGMYQLWVEDLNGCQKSASYYLTPRPEYTITTCDDQMVMLIEPEYHPAYVSWFALPAGACTSCFMTELPTTSTVGFQLQWYNPFTQQFDGCYHFSSESALYVDSLEEMCPAIITGNVFYDDNADCGYQVGEAPRPQIVVAAANENGTYHALTQPDGSYSMMVVSDTFEVSVSNPSLLEAPCNSPTSVEAETGTIDTLNLGVEAMADCPMMDVHISAPLLRRCMINYYSVNYCNQGTATAEDASILVTLDPLMTVVSAGQPYTDLGNGVLQFDLGDVAPWDCGNFSITVNLSCDAVLGQTLCVEAYATPDTICMPSPDWDGAQVLVSGICDGDSVRFTIQNIGLGNMAPPPLEYAIIEDQIILMQNTFSLPASGAIDIAVPANGSTWRVEAGQSPGFPWPSLPSAQVEGCIAGGGGSSTSTGFINQYPLDDLEPYIDIDCHTVIGSWDPNDKQGFPTGYSDEHFILPGTPIEYLIRFQNTGTDTAFRVVIRDTLSDMLDISSFQIGAWSHANRVEIKGQNILEITFDPIALPDSFVNEPASHGFFRYTIRPKADVPLGSQILNTAHIYFDYNDAVVTNTTLHTVQENFMEVTDVKQAPSGPQFNVFPNPTSGNLQLRTDRTGRYDVRITDLAGRTTLTAVLTGDTLSLDVSHLQAGIYLIEAINADGGIFSAKLVVR